MRLDKFLKVSRLPKRRTVANEACGKDRVLVNGKEAKPAKEVKPGDTVTIRFGDREFSVRVLSVENAVKKEDAAAMYEVLS